MRRVWSFWAKEVPVERWYFWLLQAVVWANIISFVWDLVQ